MKKYIFSPEITKKNLALDNKTLFKSTLKILLEVLGIALISFLIIISLVYATGRPPHKILEYLLIKIVALGLFMVFIPYALIAWVANSLTKTIVTGRNNEEYIGSYHFLPGIPFLLSRKAFLVYSNNEKKIMEQFVSKTDELNYLFTDKRFFDKYNEEIKQLEHKVLHSKILTKEAKINKEKIINDIFQDITNSEDYSKIERFINSIIDEMAFKDLRNFKKIEIAVKSALSYFTPSENLLFEFQNATEHYEYIREHSKDIIKKQVNHQLLKYKPATQKDLLD